MEDQQVIQVQQLSSHHDIDQCNNQTSNLDPSIMISDNVDWSSFLMNLSSESNNVNNNNNNNNIASDGDQLLHSLLCDDNQSNGSDPLGVGINGGNESKGEFDKIDNNSSNKKMVFNAGSSSSSNSSTRLRKARVIPRFAFKTKSSEDILDDGYRWRKYGQKSVKNSVYPRYPEP